MKIKSSELFVMATRRSQYPTENMPEFLLVGRSNVGKSSFINSLLDRKNLAYVSAHPGKTKTLNFYLVNKEFYLIDVPGYGFAQVGFQEQQKFGMMIEEYLEKRKELKRVFMLVDFRHKPTKDDLLMYHFLKYYKIPVTIVATKADKVGSSKFEKTKKTLLDTLDLVVGDDLVIYSSVDKRGRDVILKKMEDLIVDTI